MSTGTINTLNAYALVLQAEVTYWEAGGQTSEEQLAVIWSMNNRAKVASWWNSYQADIVFTLLQHMQYSCLNPGFLSADRFPKSGKARAVFNNILLLCLVPGTDDPVDGATHYYSTDIPEPEWAAKMTFVKAIGAFRFYK